MTDQEINRKIAELYGWKREKRKRWGGTDNVDGWGRNQHLSLGHKDRQFTTWLEGHIPNYCSDLNAMHEVEERLSDLEHLKFRQQLSSYFHRRPDENPFTAAWREHREAISAPARQRAEAFLRVKGEWKE